MILSQLQTGYSVKRSLKKGKMKNKITILFLLLIFFLAVPILKADNVTCISGEWRCSEDNSSIFNCTANNWQLFKTCNLPEVCIIFGTEARCSIPPQSCTPDLKRCQSGDIQRCSDDGTGWQEYVSCKKGCEIANGGSVRCFSEEFDFKNIFSSILSLGLVSIIILIVLVVLILVLWIFCLVDIFSSGNSSKWKVLWIILVTLFTAIGIIIYLLIRKKSRIERGAYSSSYPSYAGYSDHTELSSKKRKDKKKPSGENISTALLDYINAARKSKIDDAKIKKNLLGVGWNEEKVNEAFEYLG